MGIWFQGNQNHTYDYRITDFGPFTFKNLISPPPFVRYPANLGPVLDRLINDRKGQDFNYNYQLFTGVIGENKDWMLTVFLNKSISLEITFFGDLKLLEALSITITPPDLNES